jgi:hypothetical protein
MLRCNPSRIPERVARLAHQWERREGSRLFVLSGSTALERTLVDWIYAQRKHLQGVTTLDMIIDCAGGDIESAYQLIILFRSACQRIRVFVPDWAKSAATFFCLGADEIWMSPTAELGPIDAQIADPRDPDRYLSALNEFKAAEYLRTMAFETMDLMMRILVRRTRMRLRDVLSEAREFSSQLLQPLYSQIDPHYFGEAHRALEMSMEYGQRVMSRYVYKDWSKEDIKSLLSRLTWDYPSHSFVIDYQEATELGLKAQLLVGDREESAHAIVNDMEDCVGFLARDIPDPDAASVGIEETGKVVEMTAKGGDGDGSEAVS